MNGRGAGEQGSRAAEENVEGIEGAQRKHDGEPGDGKAV